MSSFSKEDNTNKKKCVDEQKCFQSLQLILDGEACREEEEYFMEHLNKCMPCFNLYKLEKAVKELLQSRIEKKQVPVDLIKSIKSQIYFFNEPLSH
jgi:anti-sigma factor (TIGR02949 family)